MSGSWPSFETEELCCLNLEDKENPLSYKVNRFLQTANTDHTNFYFIIAMFMGCNRSPTVHSF